MTSVAAIPAAVTPSEARSIATQNDGEHDRKSDADQNGQGALPDCDDDVIYEFHGVGYLVKRAKK